jgi:SAM-dependent methyltransferase
MTDKVNVTKITQITYDQIASDYSSMVDELVSDSWIGRFEESLLNDFLSLTKSTNPYVLDLGCGNGKDTEYLRQGGASVVGIDYSRGMLEEAKKRINEGIICQMDMRSLGFSGEVFDGVWANGCIYHVPKNSLLLVLQEIMRVLTPSGVLSFNFKIGTGEKLEKAPRSFQRGPRFYAYYKVNEIEKSLRMIGFEVLGVKRYPEKISNEEITQIWVRTH